MIAPVNDWFEFTSLKEKLTYLRKVGIVPPKTNWLKTLYYSGFYSSAPIQCEVVGKQPPNACVISVNGELHCISAEYLKDMQTNHLSFPEVYIVVDIETTGLIPKKNEIIEIAAVKYRHDEEVDVFETLVKPVSEISGSISRLTGITNDLVSNSPTVDFVIPGFIEFVEDFPLVAHNGAFDIGFIRSVCERMGYEINNHLFDTLKLARKAYPGLKCHKLSYLKEELNIGAEESHRALPDVYSTAALFKLCRNRLNAEQCEVSDEQRID